MSNSNLESTAEALEALMKIRSSPSAASLLSLKSHENRDAHATTATGINNNPMILRGNDKTDQSVHAVMNEPNSKQPVPIAPMIQHPMEVQNRAYNFPISAASVSQQQQASNVQLGRNYGNSIAEWQIGMHPTHTNMHSYVESSMAAYLNRPSSNAILPQSQNISTPHQREVRTSEVERALRSKPQRGKKRNNLNNDERKELTRSRNRMHAKTTRQRKKARYDELEECERKYQKLIKEKVLSDARRKTVLQFIAFCSSLINSQQAAPNTTDSSGNSTCWMSMFGGHASAIDVENATSVPKEVEIQYMFAPGALFSVTSVFGTNRQNLDLQHFQECMHYCAHDLREMISDSNEEIRFTYIIPGSGNDIALSASHSAFSTYQIVANTSGSIPLSSGLVHVRFDEQSHRILSASMHSISVEHNLENDNEKATSSPLGNCEIFPSVVSLEKHTENKKKDI